MGKENQIESPQHRTLRDFVEYLTSGQNPYVVKPEEVSNLDDYVAIVYDEKRVAFAVIDAFEEADKYKLDLGDKKVRLKNSPWALYPRELFFPTASCLNEQDPGKNRPLIYIDPKRDFVLSCSNETTPKDQAESWGSFKEEFLSESEYRNSQELEQHFDDLQNFSETHAIPADFFQKQVPVQTEWTKEDGKKYTDLEILLNFKTQAILYKMHLEHFSEKLSNVVDSLPDNEFTQELRSYLGFETVLLARLMDGRIRIEQEERPAGIFATYRPKQDLILFNIGDEIPWVNNMADTFSILHELKHAYSDARSDPEGRDDDNNIPPRQDEFFADFFKHFIGQVVFEIDEDTEFSNPRLDKAFDTLDYPDYHRHINRMEKDVKAKTRSAMHRLNNELINGNFSEQTLTETETAQSANYYFGSITLIRINGI